MKLSLSSPAFIEAKPHVRKVCDFWTTPTNIYNDSIRRNALLSTLYSAIPGRNLMKLSLSSPAFIETRPRVRKVCDFWTMPTTRYNDSILRKTLLSTLYSATLIET